jgi:hypothetical protein
MTGGGGSTIVSVLSPADPDGPSLGALIRRRTSRAMLAMALVLVAAVATVLAGSTGTAAALAGGAPPVTTDTTTTVPPDPEPTVPPTPEPTVPPTPTSTVAPSTSTTFVPVPTAPAPTVTTTSPSVAPSTSTTEPTDSSVVADDRTVIDPAPGAVNPNSDGDETVADDAGPGWWTAETRLRLAVAGLGGLAMVVSVLTLLYWRHTKPDISMGRSGDPVDDEA